jgi:hypothetical protein
VVVLEAKQLLLKVKAEESDEDYEEACEHVAEMIGIGVSTRRCSVKKRRRIVGSLFLATQAHMRGSFVRDLVTLKGEAIVSTLAAYYSTIEGAVVTADQLRKEAELS